MDSSYWKSKWDANDIAFHKRKAHPLLVKHFVTLTQTEGSRVFLPLCGKTRDIAWLLDQGYQVVGCELVESAIVQLFEELDVEPSVVEGEHIRHYRAESLEILVGDFFTLSRKTLGKVNAVYDRAALVALPSDMREKYTEHLINITANAPQLLITFTYDQQLLKGPPFNVDSDEVARHYDSDYELLLLERVEVTGGLKGVCPADELVWQLRPVNRP